ncbi:RdgB/HAM1 family non-canonical purine NTP pyrophosphatase [Rhodovibrio salinarum]|uniref:dITP/XTP pyrophosphatase n=1 Tax=Rhodovibrio salinarum TaxID=1087 RepID=A0A934UZN7_9PROT|nr:RdgB/HAM1 family non-canonical purine NTP pyrophosphatase [Rhodovibrio salinarum]MBK1696943.1 non-canonical purine NTP pyrophosphatase [Rhodovibrio salinarum]
MPLGADTLVIASHNPGKVREIAELLEPFGTTVKSAGELGLPEPEETGHTFAENAELKARASAKGANLPALADDSGLAVTALGGKPGIYSARWAGPDKDFHAAMDRVEQELREVNAGTGGDRSACFVCALTLAWPEGTTRTFQGQVDGTLTYPPRGTRGFGYDPVFVPDGHAITFGEMEPAAKHAMSHRARAFRQLVDAVFRT